ncbi:probable cytochrome P450 317a1 [Teleopsis dalmanni]|uniref:probable cytochrome P450 317a1 n=1 Tax=Teleopsis dalmanni TaxID=139649 RepID=UPI0018CE0F68|nr:probable cytochrome P450 317a1 [Teleopsis dalmanni]
MATVWVMYIILSLIIGLIIVLAAIFFRYKRYYWKFLDVPHDHPRPLLSVLGAINRSGTYTEKERLDYYDTLYKRFKGTGPFCGYYNVLQPRVLVLDRDLVTQILIKDFSNFNDRGMYYNSKVDPLSADLYHLKGSSWKEMRIKLDPIYRKEQMSYLFTSVYEESHHLLTAFEEGLQNGVLNDFAQIKQIIHRFVLTIIAKYVFGMVTNSHQDKSILDEFDAMTQLALTTQRHGRFFNALLSRHRSTGRKLGCGVTNKKAEEYFLTLISEVVANREKFGTDAYDYMQLLINLKTQEYSTHETEDITNSKELKEHLMKELAAHAFVFLRAGLNPIANTISYVLHELALNQWAQERVRKETQTALQKNNEFNYECVQAMKFMGQVISETLRLHPVTPYLVRRTLHNYIVPNNPRYVIQRDMYVIIPTHAMHNDAEIYAEPHLFKPERFCGEENRSREPGTWLGFGEGPRDCIGKHFAQLIVRIAIARLLTQYNFTLDLKKLIVESQTGAGLSIRRISAPKDGQEANVVI